jgi:mRNA interferase MazF
MVDKLVTVRRDRIGRRFGRLSDTDVLRLNRALLVFLGLAGG